MAFDALFRTTLGRIAQLVFFHHQWSTRVLTLYFDAKPKVKMPQYLNMGQRFNLQRGVRQGCPASPSFFTGPLSFISWSFRLTYEGIKLVTLHLSTLEYADDQILFTLIAGGIHSMLDFIVDMLNSQDCVYHRNSVPWHLFSQSWYLGATFTIYQGYQSETEFYHGNSRLVTLVVGSMMSVTLLLL